MKLELAFIRCGKTQSDIENKRFGQADEPLQKEEIARLQLQRAHYPKVALVYTDDTQRCRQTAAAIYPRVPAVLLRGLRPLDAGELQGRLLDEILADKQIETWAKAKELRPCPGGEDPHQFAARCYRTFLDITEEMNSKGIERTALITHSSVIAAILQRYCIPRSVYHDWGVEWGNGYTIEYDSSLGTAKILQQLNFRQEN